MTATTRDLWQESEDNRGTVGMSGGDPGIRLPNPSDSRAGRKSQTTLRFPRGEFMNAISTSLNTSSGHRESFSYGQLQLLNANGSEFRKNLWICLYFLSSADFYTIRQIPKGDIKRNIKVSNCESFGNRKCFSDH